MTPCLETLSHCLCVFFGENISFLEAKATYIERLLSYPKKGEQVLEAIRTFLWHKKRASQYSAIKLSVICLFFPSAEYTPPLLLPCSYYSKIRYAFDLFQSYFYPVPFQFVNESYEKQEVAKIVCQV